MTSENPSHHSYPYEKKKSLNVAVKERIAKAVVERFFRPEGIDAIVVGDGTSTDPVARFCINAPANPPPHERLSVFTNNVYLLDAVALPGVNTHVDMYTACGKFNRHYGANFGSDTTRWMANKCKGHVCILAVSSLDAEFGPCGDGDEPRAIKRAMLEHAQTLIVIADSTKLQRPQHSSPKTVDARLWKSWLRRKDLWVFASITRQTQSASTPIKDPQSDSDWECNNFLKLQDKLNKNGRERFVVVDH